MCLPVNAKHVKVNVNNVHRIQRALYAKMDFICLDLNVWMNVLIELILLILATYVFLVYSPVAIVLILNSVSLAK